MIMKCIYCKNACLKKGKRRGIQRYQCKTCKRNFQQQYIKVKIPEQKYRWIEDLNNECCSISSIARLLEITRSSVQRIISRISEKRPWPNSDKYGQIYEIDELRTYCRNKKTECWVMYAINKASKNIITACVGRRTKENLKKIIDILLSLRPRKICTDRLNIYPSLIPQKIHKVYQYSTNRIERKNLTLRTHLKRLSRKTLCYTKSNTMLENCLKIYAGQRKDGQNALSCVGLSVS